MNLDLVASDPALSWASAVWFWSSSCLGRGSNVGQATMCVNSNECNSATSSVYYQFAPVYRLQLANDIASKLGVSAGSSDSIVNLIHIS